MSKVTFLDENLLLKANLTLLSGVADAQFPLSNIKHPFTTKVFRSSSTTVEILIDLQTIQNVDIVAIKGSSVSGIGFNTATVEGSATLMFAGTPTSIEVSSMHNFAFSNLTSSPNRYWKFTFTGGDYVELSNIFIGKKTQLMDNSLSIGFSYSKNTNSVISRNSYGQKFIDTFNSVDVLSGDIKLVNNVEFDQLNNIHINHGEHTPLWFLLDSSSDMGITDSKFLFSGYFYMKDLVWRSVAPGLYDVTLSLEEAT
jgi:hypothetical protein